MVKKTTEPEDEEEQEVMCDIKVFVSFVHFVVTNFINHQKHKRHEYDTKAELPAIADKFPYGVVTAL